MDIYNKIISYLLYDKHSILEIIQNKLKCDTNLCNANNFNSIKMHSVVYYTCLLTKYIDWYISKKLIHGMRTMCKPYKSFNSYKTCMHLIDDIDSVKYNPIMLLENN